MGNRPAARADLPEVSAFEARDGLGAELLALAARAEARASADMVREPAPEWRDSLPDPRRRTRAGTIKQGLVLADIAGFVAAFFVVQLVVSSFEPSDLRITAFLPAGLIGWIALAQAYGLYDRDAVSVARSVADELPSLVLLSSLATWLGILIVNSANLAEPRLHITTTFWISSILLITAGRAAARSITYRKLAPKERIAIIGTGLVAQRVAVKLAAHPEYRLEVVGFVDDEPLPLPDESPPYLGDLARLERVVRAHAIERVIIAFSKLSGDAQVGLLKRCAELGVRVDIVPRMFEVIGSRTVVHDIGGLPLVSLKPPKLSRVARLLKRGMDLGIAGTALVLLAPFIAFAAVRIKLASAGPVFFRQERMGAGGRTFRIFKFRSMYADADARKHEVTHLNMHDETGPKMFKIADDPRITPFGRFLRRWSLDELPQLFNVIRGEMSLVGPRPLILAEDENIRGHHRRRLNITPGVTGLWQVLGRSDIPFSEMVGLDYLYVTNWSLWGDIKLLARTVPAVLARRGAY